MKRIAICMDGTWQTLQQERKTNINIIARSVAHSVNGIEQIVIYQPGVGATIDALKGRRGRLDALATTLGSFAGGLFGDGLEDLILNTYLQLAFNYEAGDQIYIFGFSRGAFAARSLAGLIGKSGIVSRRFAEKAQDAFDFYRNPNIAADDRQMVEFRTTFGKRIFRDGVRVHADHRPQIAYLGIFDTVGQRGLPSALGPISDWLNQRYAFHDLSLSQFVLSARHAVAIDERRAAFPPTLWTNLDELNETARAAGRQTEYEQRWFVGAHGDVGGGSASFLSSFPLGWIVEGAERVGLVMDRTKESPLSEALLDICLDPAQPISRAAGLAALHPINWSGQWRKIPHGAEAPSRPYTELVLHHSVAMRTASPNVRKPYRPPPLKDFEPVLAEMVAGPALVADLVRIVRRGRRRRGIFGLLGGGKS